MLHSPEAAYHSKHREYSGDAAIEQAAMLNESCADLSCSAVRDQAETKRCDRIGCRLRSTRARRSGQRESQGMYGDPCRHFPLIARRRCLTVVSGGDMEAQTTIRYESTSATYPVSMNQDRRL